MGASSSGGGAGGNTGADAGFFVSQDKKKSKLSKKNQALVDASFKDRGAVKIDSQFKTPAVAILSGPLKYGSKVNRDFFTNKVLGSKNYRGTSKKDFLNMSVSQQESIYGDYMKGRQTGKTDAYGNPIRDIDRNDPPRVITKNIGGTNVQMKAPTEAEVSQSESTSTESESTSTEYDPRKTKRRGRRMTILSKNLGNFTLSKPTLLGY